MQNTEPVVRKPVARWLPPIPPTTQGSPSTVSTISTFPTRWRVTNVQNSPQTQASNSPPTRSTAHTNFPTQRSIPRHAPPTPAVQTRRVKFAATPSRVPFAPSYSSSSTLTRSPLASSPWINQTVSASPNDETASFASFSSHSSLYPSIRAGSRTIVNAPPTTTAYALATNAYSPQVPINVYSPPANARLVEPRIHRPRRAFVPRASPSNLSLGASSPASFASTYTTASASAEASAKSIKRSPKQVTTLPFSVDSLRALVPYIDIDASDVLQVQNMFVKGRMCPECGDDLPSVGRQLWQTNETPQDTAAFLRIRCPSCQVDYCCGCLADWKSCAAQLRRPTFPASDAPCAKGCAIGVFEILDALDRACVAHPLRAEEVPLMLKASCELLARVLVHPFHGGDSHQAIGVLLAASRLPALLVLLFARTTTTQLWIARAELYRAALDVLWRIVGTPEILVGLITLPRVLRTCGLRAWIVGEGEISWSVARDGSGGIKELVMVLAERRLELEREMKGAEAEVKKTLGLLVGDIIAVEKQAKLASLS
ncbi:uncharacterized protein SCHCODRAFT_02703552 [Schizophyllum commune H4-8]|uniref:uncharacterized protein n=1 Tax=Schizophyllum commune (strain H4-8 / FGSC 9210) TaxID=578458 RepID=UPI00215FD353|nr:uncharacterized protein SCHCODRAFT_02703552 [Schizophyllum commune H4-8]KAI5889108.1 hypothetical protein SCHCODRAFT_02703552 [Schizophyllum commune H4-8]